MTHTCILSNITEAPEFYHLLYRDTVMDPGIGQGDLPKKYVIWASEYNMGPRKWGVRGPRAPGLTHPGSATGDVNCLGDIHRWQCIPTHIFVTLKQHLLRNNWSVLTTNMYRSFPIISKILCTSIYIQLSGTVF